VIQGFFTWIIFSYFGNQDKGPLLEVPIIPPAKRIRDYRGRIEGWGELTMGFSLASWVEWEFPVQLIYALLNKGAYDVELVTPARDSHHKNDCEVPCVRGLPVLLSSPCPTGIHVGSLIISCHSW